ncbi:hypothetical protein Goklo_019261, partial [Gossypium klotzschianum]|nr:hypothetical protein [Gossypium klotzschianum]
DTGSQVCSLLWSKNERELLSSHGFTQNQLTLWKYPSMVKMAELTGHTSRVLYMAQSPDGCTVASAAGDETLRFWNVFGVPEVAKTAPKEMVPDAVPVVPNSTMDGPVVVPSKPASSYPKADDGDLLHLEQSRLWEATMDFSNKPTAVTKRVEGTPNLRWFQKVRV